MATIMAALDGSRFAEQALPWAVALARGRGAALHLVIVRSALPLGADAGGAERYVRSVAARLEAELPAGVTPVVLTEEHGPLHYPPPATTPVADLLAHYAEAHDVELIVAATHGRGGVHRLWLGSVADSLLRTAPRPFLLVRPDGATAAVQRGAIRVRHVLVPLDGSAIAEKAIAHARRIGEPFGARYTLVRVVPPIDEQFTVGGLHVHPTPYTLLQTRHAATHYLEHVAAPLRADGLHVHTCALEHPAPAAALLDYARTHAVDVVAMTTSGLGGVRRLLIGSVTDKLVRAGELPILSCNEQRPEHEESHAREPEHALAGKDGDAPQERLEQPSSPTVHTGARTAEVGATG